MTSSSFTLIVFSVSMNALAQVALRKAMLTLGRLPSISEPLACLRTFISNVYLWGGLACYFVGILFWLAVLSSNQVSVAYPMLSIGYVIALAFSVLVLGEEIPLARLVGIALICVGVALISGTT
ncbi:EamA family transporter [Bradyrhizobium sp. DASA03076]|uniref:EamA family transporter n=1 Tax=Bradyrhizobium sp. BLXBL-03 TaxID=3395916 RepID=UPI003F6F5DCF